MHCNRVGEFGIRVNSIHPYSIDTLDGRGRGHDGDLRKVPAQFPYRADAVQTERITPARPDCRSSCVRRRWPMYVVAWPGDASATISGIADRRRPRHDEVLTPAFSLAPPKRAFGRMGLLGEHHHRHGAVPDDLAPCEPRWNTPLMPRRPVVPSISSSPSSHRCCPAPDPSRSR